MTSFILALILLSLSSSWTNTFTVPATNLGRVPAAMAFHDSLTKPLALQKGEQNQEPVRKTSIPSWISSTIVATSMMVGVSFMNMPFWPTPPALAETSKVVGKLQGSGLVFKDTLLIERFEGRKSMCCCCSCSCCCNDHVYDFHQRVLSS